MDVGPVSSQSPYRYQQAQPAPQAPSSEARDPLAALAAASAVSSQGGGLAASAQGGKPAGGAEPPLSAINGLEMPTSSRGMDASSAASLLATLGNPGDGPNSQGFEAALSGGSIVAMAAYQVQLAFPGNAPEPSAAAAAPSLAPPASVAAPAAGTPNATAQDSASAGAVQQAIQAALNPGNLSLFA